ncbi:MAG: HEAT repeat domain-containing protein, partial [Gammaproteobacteria bacterium]|nr:HEAT repeat domain-containing protein [Gammaproteobacteria bacterium]
FLDNLKSDTTLVRTATTNLLGQSQQITPAKLFKRLHEGSSPRTEIIDILELQQKNLPPELYIKSALKMEKDYACRLLEIATANATRTDMSTLNIDINSLDNPDVKIMLVRFLAAVNNSEAANTICLFLGDKSKIIVIEALKSLKHMGAEFDPTPVIKFMRQMNEENLTTAFEILRLKSTAKTLPALTVLMTGKSDDFRQQSSEIVIQHASTESLEAVLLALDKHEWWGKEQAIKSLLSQGNDKLLSAAAKLVKHQNEFVRGAAEQLLTNYATDSGDISNLSKSLIHDDWQVRERAIEKIGNSGNKSALDQLAKVIQDKPESSIAVLKAVTKLGFAKGLEIATSCLHKNEAAIQREALLTMSE